MRIFEWLAILVVLMVSPVIRWMVAIVAIINWGVVFYAGHTNNITPGYDGVQKMATDIYRRHGITKPAKVRNKRYEKRDLDVPTDIHVIYVNLYRGITGRLFPLYYYSRTINTIVDSVKVIDEDSDIDVVDEILITLSLKRSIA